MAVTQIRGDKQIKAATVSEFELNTSVAGDGITGGGGSALAVVADITETSTVLASAISVDANGVSVKVDDTTLEGSLQGVAGTESLRVKDLGIDTAQLAADAVDGTKIADDSIDSEHYVADSIDAEHYAPDSVDKDAINADIAGLGLGQAAGGELDVNVDDSTIEINTDTLRVKANGIDTNELAADAVTGAEIEDAAVNSEHIASGAVDVDHLSDYRVTEGTGLNADVAAGVIRSDNAISSTTAGTIAVTDDDVTFVEVDASGTVSANIVGFTTGRVPLAEVTAAAGDITVVTDRRAWLDVEIGASGLTNDNFITREDVAFDFDGVDATGVLANTPVVGSEEVYSNGILQNEGASDDYQISGATITFNAGSEPESGDEVLVSYRK